MPNPDEAPSGSPTPPPQPVTGRLPHGLRPIIPPGATLVPAPPLRPLHAPPPPVVLPPPSIQPHLPLVQPPASMLATGLLPLDTEAASKPPQPYVLPPLPPVMPPAPVEGTLSTGLLPGATPPPANPTGTQRLVEDGPAKSQEEIKVPSSHQSPSSPESHPRKHAVEEEKAAKLGLRPVEATLLPAARPANQRRSSHTFKLFVVLLFIMMASFAAFAGLLYNFFQQNIEPHLGTVHPVTAAPTQVPDNKPSEELKTALAAANDRLAALQTEVETLRAQQGTTDEKLKNLAAPTPPSPKEEPAAPSTQLTLADGQISRLQAQVNELRTQQTEAEAKLQKMAVPAPKSEDNKTPALLAAATEKMNLLQSQVDASAAQQAKNAELLRELMEKSPPIDKPEPSPPASPAYSPPTISSVVALSSDTGQELRILKERNRLTLYADQALANASAEAMANLWRSLRDPDLAFVKDGIVAEIVRVQHFYGSIRGLPASYRLPVAELFKDGSVATEADLKDEQAIQLLLDQAQPPEVRTRAAAFLSGHKTKAVGEALVEAMRHDSNLLVVKAAQNTLQENFELYEPRLFDAIGMEKAWQAKREKLEPQKSEVEAPK